MIVSFDNKHLRDLWETGRSRRIDSRMHARILRRLDALDNALQPRDLDLPGFDFHALIGYSPTRYTIHVNGPWCVTFEFEDGDALKVNYEQYH